MTHPTHRTFEPCRNWDVVRTWGRETNRSTSCQLSKRTGGGKELEGRSARSVFRSACRSGGPPSPAPRRGTVLPVGRLYGPQPVSVRATAPARPRAASERCRAGCVRSRSGFGPESGPCAAFPQAGAAVSPASLSLNIRAGSAVDVGYKKANQTTTSRALETYYV